MKRRADTGMWNTDERAILEALDAALQGASVAERLDPIATAASRKLAGDPDARLAWEPVPLRLYGRDLPDPIRSSWVFVLRAGAVTGAERHPNSHQRMVSYRGNGDLQVWTDGRWDSNHLISDPGTSLERRWVSIPPNVIHQVVVPSRDWIVVSFHTAPAAELIEERLDPADPGRTHQSRYWDGSDPRRAAPELGPARS